MAKSNKSIFSFPNTSSTLAPKQKTFWDLANEKADKIRKERNEADAKANATKLGSEFIQPNTTQPSIGDSYNKMIGQYEPDISKFTGMLPSTNQFTEQPGNNGFYGSMSGLEGASMRLANAASQRSMAEAGYGSGLKRGETANEYGLRDISTAKEYGLKGDLLGKEYGLKESQAARASGYMSPFEMQMDARKKRAEDERIQKQQYELQRKAQIQAKQFGR
jgi:hypothetical protein